MNISESRLTQGLMGFILMIFLAGCAVTGSKVVKQEQAPAEAVEVLKSALSVNAISVVGDGDALMISTTGPVRYTVFRLSDPDRLIVDLPGVELENVPTEIEVNNDYLDDISASTYGDGTKTIARIVVNLKSGIDHDVKSGENSILVELKRDIYISGFSAESKPGHEEEPIDEEAVTSEDLPLELAEGGGPVASVQHLMGDPGTVELTDIAQAEHTGEPVSGVMVGEAPARKASRLVGIESFNEEDGTTVIKVAANGSVASYNSFELDEPSRLVIDLWGVESAIGKYLVSIDSPHINAVRVGRHPDKTRLVFDAEKEKVPPHTVDRGADSMVFKFGEKFEEQAAEPVKAAPEEPVETAPEEPVVIALEEPVETASLVLPGTVTITSALPEPGQVPEAEEKADDMESAVPAFGVEPEMEEVAEEAAEPVQTASLEESGSLVVTSPLPEPGEVQEVQAEAEDMESAVPAWGPEPESLEEEVRAVSKEPAVRVEKVTFRKLKDMARLLVVNSEKTEYSVKESLDGKMLTLEIKGAVLAEELKKTLDATKLGTPVISVSSYQASLEPREDVKVLVRLKGKVSYEVGEVNGSITVDFPLAVPGPETARMAEVEQEVVPMLGEGKKYTGRKIDLDMMDAEITDILKLLAEVSNLNIIAGDDVRGTITLRLKNVPWDQAFDIILETKGLDRVQVGNVIRVAPAERIRQEKEAILAARKAQEKLEDLTIEFVSINYASAADLEKQVKEVLSARGSVSSESRTNTLIIKDIKEGIASAKNLIDELDKPIPQVLIEARIVEATSSFARDLGVQWGVDYATTGRVHTDVFGSTENFGSAPHDPNVQSAISPGGGVLNKDKIDWPVTPGVTNYGVNLPATGTAGTLGALGFVLGSMTGQNPLILDLRISAGESEGLVKTISRPRITTMDNKEAKIEQGESIPFETTSAAGTATEFIDANLSLTVTPHITPDGSVLMKIKASRNSIGTFRTSAGEPSINRKEASTEVLVKDGETTVMGGIVISDTSDTEKGLPFLRKIPILGWLFKSRSLTDTQTELLIFITPSIVKEKKIG